MIRHRPVRDHGGNGVERNEWTLHASTPGGGCSYSSLSVGSFVRPPLKFLTSNDWETTFKEKELVTLFVVVVVGRKLVKEKEIK